MADTKTKQKPAPAGTLPPVSNSETTTSTPAVQPVGDQTLRLPPEQRKARAKREAPSNVITCTPGQTYHMRLGDGDTAKQIPFSLPRGVTTPTKVTLASTNPNWLGRDGAELRAHICASADGVVILQPNGEGWKANVFGTDRITFA